MRKVIATLLIFAVSGVALDAGAARKSRKRKKSLSEICWDEGEDCRALAQKYSLERRRELRNMTWPYTIPEKRLPKCVRQTSALVKGLEKQVPFFEKEANDAPCVHKAMHCANLAIVMFHYMGLIEGKGKICKSRLEDAKKRRKAAKQKRRKKRKK